MDASTFFDFIKELSRCDYIAGSEECIEKFTYNGITYAQGRETYDKKLSDMFFSCKQELMSIMTSGTSGGTVLSTMMSECKKVQSQYYDIPDKSYIDGMERDYEGSNNASLLKSIREAKFLNDMVAIQKNYLSELIDYIGNLLGEKKPENVINETEVNQKPQESNIIKGVQGLADYLSCGKSKAQAIISSKILIEEGIQYHSGGHRFKKDKLDALLTKQPEIFNKYRCPH